MSQSTTPAQRQPKGWFEERVAAVLAVAAVGFLGGSSYRLHDLSSRLPGNSSQVPVRRIVKVLGGAATGRTSCNVRQNGRTIDDIELGPLAEFTDGMLFEGWVHVGADKTIQVGSDSTKIASYQVNVCGYRNGAPT